MNPTPLAPPTPEQKRRSIILVLCCTLIGATAQVLIKLGASSLSQNAGLTQAITRILTHPPLFAGYALYGVSTVLLVLALRHGELSLLYPVIALTFVWVTILSVIIFHDTLNLPKLAGIAIIIGGVAILGRGTPGRSQVAPAKLTQ